MAGPYCTCVAKVPTQIFTRYQQRAHEMTKQGIRSTREKFPQELETIETEQCINPPMEEEEMNQLFACHAWINHKDGTVYTDYTGKFPIRSMDGMTAIFIMYDWTSNVILAMPVKDC